MQTKTDAGRRMVVLGAALLVLIIIVIAATGRYGKADNVQALATTGRR